MIALTAGTCYRSEHVTYRHAVVTTWFVCAHFRHCKYLTAHARYVRRVKVNLRCLLSNDNDDKDGGRSRDPDDVIVSTERRAATSRFVYPLSLITIGFLLLILRYFLVVCRFTLIKLI